jgi:hypothetical protein
VSKRERDREREREKEREQEGGSKQEMCVLLIFLLFCLGEWILTVLPPQHLKPPAK